MLLHHTVTGKGETIILLHGMAASGRYWEQLLPYISVGHRVITLDLLGFGRSPTPKHITYNYASHIQCIVDTLEDMAIVDPFILVGHSMGALIALRLASQYPEKIKKLVLVGMPIYNSPRQAHRDIVATSKLKELAYYGPTSKALCGLWCGLLRPVSSRLAHLYLPSLTKAVASDSVLHTWQSYSQSLRNVLERQHAGVDIKKYGKRVRLIYGDKDLPRGTMPGASDAQISILPGTHQVVNEQQADIAQIILMN